MDFALLLLWRLRLKAWFRRWGKNLRSAKGIGLTLVGALVFVPWAWSVLFAPTRPNGMSIETVRRFGPLALLAFGVLTLVLSGGERALFFTPAEIAFLFPGPFTRKAILRYKVVGAIWGCAFSSVFMTVAFARSSRSYVASYFALLWVMLFFHFLTMAVSLASSTVAILATNARRKIVLGAFVTLAAATVLSVGKGLLELPGVEVLKRLENSPVLQVVTTPLKPFVFAFAAPAIWPDLIGWSAVCIVMVVAMAGLVFATDAQYLESAAASSAKIYEQLQRMRKGGLAGASRKPKSTRVRLDMLPWWGGIGPILWRQLSTAAREPVRVTLAFVVMLGPGLVLMFAIPGGPGGDHGMLFAARAIALWISIFLSPLVAFDFRGDIDRMEELKTLPTPPVSLVLGQVLTPVLIFTLPQWIGFGAALAWLGMLNLDHWAAAALVLPATFLLFGIENFLFLLFPTRVMAANPADFTAFGRQILLMLAKLLGILVTLGSSALLGVGAFYLLGASRSVALMIAVCCTFGFAALIIPLMVWAFQRYDVARDTPA